MNSIKYLGATFLANQQTLSLPHLYGRGDLGKFPEICGTDFSFSYFIFMDREVPTSPCTIYSLVLNAELPF